jgi:predicted permease
MSDIRLAVRSLRSTPVVSAVAALSLALGIGANTAIFSLVNSLLLRPLPVAEPTRLGLIAQSGPGNTSWTYPIWEEIRTRPDLFARAGAWSSTRFNLSSSGETKFVDGIWASGRFFETLGVPALLGRTFSEDDDKRGGGTSGPVAVISYGFWQRHFGGAASAIGGPLTIDRVAFTVVGVTPPDFLGADVGRAFDVAVPFGCEPLLRGKDSGLERRSMWWLSVIARLKPGQTFDAATAALRGVQPQIKEATLPQDWRREDQLTYLKEPLHLQPAATGSSGLRSRYERPLWTLLGVVALVLLIACANIANLLLARASARRHELSVRLALGASRWRLGRQLLTESLVLSVSGAVAGTLFALWGSRLLVAQLSTSTNRVVLELTPDWRLLLFTTAVTIATALLFGTAPAFRAGRVDPIESLKTDGRGSVGDSRSRLATGLVVAQVALSLVLVVAAGLFVRTFTRLANLQLGFDEERLLVTNVGALRSRVPQAERSQLFERTRQSVLALPGVAQAALSTVTPVSGMTWNSALEVVGAPKLPERQSVSNVNYVSPGFFATYGTPLVAGRDISERDVAGAPLVVVVNQAFARKFLDGKSPLGHVVRETRMAAGVAPKEWQIVGLAADAVYRSLREPVPPTMYFAIAQYDASRFPLTSAAVSVRAASGSPMLLTRSVARAIAGVDPDVTMTFRALAEQVEASLVQERLIAMLSGFFGLLALLLAGLGLYGVTSYAVTRRRSEIGIRMALGAAPGGVVRLVLRRVAALVGAGVLLGTAASFWAASLVATLLFGVEARDPATLVLAAVVLSAVGALAGWLPARRAAQIDPARVLREG